MTQKTFFLLLLVTLGCSFEVDMKSRIETNGIYECISPVDGAPIYQFNSESDTSRLVMGTNGYGFRFVDLVTGDTVKLAEDSMQYNCNNLGVK